MRTMATRCVPATAVPVCSTNTTLTPAVRCVTLQRVAVYGAREVYSSQTGPIRKLNSALVAALRPANASLFVALDVVDDEVRSARAGLQQWLQVDPPVVCAAQLRVSTCESRARGCALVWQGLP